MFLNIAMILLLLQWEADKRLVDKEGLTPDLVAQNILISRLISTFNDVNESPSSSATLRLWTGIKRQLSIKRTPQAK